MKHKKWLALFLAAALTVSTAMPAPMTVVASEQENEPVVTETVEEPEQKAETEEAAKTEEKTESEEVTTPEGKTEGEEMTTPEEKTEGEEVTTPEGKTEGEEVTTPEGKTEGEEVTTPEEKTEGEEVTTPEGKTESEEVTTPEGKTEGEEVTTPEETTEEVSEEETVVKEEIEGQPAVQSLLPLEEKDAYMILNNYTEDQVKAMPVSTMLGLLRDSDGNKIDIPASATAVWTYFKDGNGNTLSDEYHAVSSDETIDMSIAWDSSWGADYRMEVIVGNGKQLDASAIRYIVRVYVSKGIEEEIKYELYTQDEYSYRDNVSTSVESTDYSVDAADNTSVRTTVYKAAGHTVGTEYYLGIDSDAAKRDDISAEVYTPAEFKKFLAGENCTAITDQILNQDMYSENAGYKGTFDQKTRFFMVYKDKESGRVFGWVALDFSVIADLTYYNFSGGIYAFDGQKMVEAAPYATNFGTSMNSKGFEINKDTGSVDTYSIYASKNFHLNEGYKEDADYYFVLDVKDNNGNDASAHVSRIVKGYDEDEQTDIRDQILVMDKTQAVYGYKSEGKNKNDLYFTVYFDNGTSTKVNMWVSGSSYSSDEDIDPSFYVYGAKQGENEYTTSRYDDDFRVYKVYGKLDSYYKNGYQTLFINNADVDLSQLKPFFSTNSDKTRVYVGTEQKSGESVQDFSKGPVQYTAIIDGKQQKNYQVAFVKKTTGAKLYVNGPSEREVMLNEDNEYQHDILISNIGDAELTGLKVELNATHAKLDDYWTVGGDGNDKLGAFTTTSKTTNAGELPNLAKIRILPDGTGTISGTLTISADGQEPVVIKLKGYASNPYITTEGLAEGVKYVPYSFVVATNNMHKWNNVEFKIKSGRLPNGVTLSSVNGEIYGVPTEAGEFPIRIEASYSSSKFKPYYADLTLVVKENTNENVYNASDEGYELKEALGVDVGNHDYVLKNTKDQLFVSTGVLGEFQDLWLNGEKLVDGVDYTKVSGSTRITVRSQTFKNKLQEGTNTIAAEFRVDGDKNKELKRTAQNFRLEIKGGNGGGSKKHSGGGSGSGSGNESTASATATTAAGTTAGAVAFDGVKFVAHVMDANNQPMASTTVELHSTPQTALTNVSGYATFNPVEFGTHTFIVKDSAGNVLATKEFELQEGNSVVINGSKLVAKNGSTVALSLKVENGELAFVSAVATGDHEQPIVWMVMLLSCLVILGVVGYRKRNMWFKRQ